MKCKTIALVTAFAISSSAGTTTGGAATSVTTGSTNELTTTGNASSPNTPRAAPVQSDKMNSEPASTGETTNSINDNGVSQTTGSPGIQSGKIK
jgi:hypothetical protein